jgi:KDO2-lipid IV(A) lauroyltransferase
MSFRRLIASLAKVVSFRPLAHISFLAFLGASLTRQYNNTDNRRPRLLHDGLFRRLEVATFRLIIVPLVAFLPAPLAYGIARFYGDVQFQWDAARRNQILYCLINVLSDQIQPAEQMQMVRDIFRLRACEAIDVMRLARSGQTLARQVEIRGLEHIEAALAAGKGAILCGAHFGSYGSAFALIGIKGFPLTIIGRWPSKVDRNRSALERFFFQFLFRKPVEHHLRTSIEPRAGKLGIAVEAASVLRKNELVGVLLDSPVIAADRERAVPMDFLNGQALLLPGTITIAQLIGSPVLMMFLHRSEDWRHQVLEIAPPLSLEGDSLTAFKRGLAIVEEAIRKEPAHWIYWELSVLIQFGLLSDTDK